MNIVAPAILLPLPSLVRLLGDIDDVFLAENLVQLAVVAGMIGFCVGIVNVRRRFSAVLMLGGVGYCVATLFVIQGAPDLALTQFLIETLSIVIFVLVLRNLPRYHRHVRWNLGQNARRAVAVAVGLFVFAFVLVSGSYQAGPSVSERYLVLAPEEAEGRNVVNVILVDFRGLDTFGEITVLCVATLGIASLVIATRRKDRHDFELAERSAGVDPRQVPLNPESTPLPTDIPEPEPIHRIPVGESGPGKPPSGNPASGTSASSRPEGSR